MLRRPPEMESPHRRSWKHSRSMRLQLPARPCAVSHSDCSTWSYRISIETRVVRKNIAVRRSFLVGRPNHADTDTFDESAGSLTISQWQRPLDSIDTAADNTK